MEKICTNSYIFGGKIEIYSFSKAFQYFFFPEKISKFMLFQWII